MKPVDSTAEILYLRMLNGSVDNRWTDWAYEMLVAGFDTENLVMLAGETVFYNQFEMQRLVDKVFGELNLSWDNREVILAGYVCYLIKKALKDEKEINIVLSVLKEVYFYWDCEKSLEDFAMLHWAKDDLDKYGDQHYWDGATKENIDAIIIDCFRGWVRKCNE